MGQVCGCFGISRQAHYQQCWREARREAQRGEVRQLVQQVRAQHPRMGGRKLLDKIQPLLQERGQSIGRDRLLDVLREGDLLVKPRRSYHRTTIPGLYRAPNRLLGLVIGDANQVWVGDITYLALERGGFAYLFLLMDLYSRYILGWHVAPSLAADGALACLHMALPHHLPSPHALIHHSDHGVQYTCRAYLDTLLAQHILPSMGAIGNCYDNIYAERLINTLKNEYLLDRPFAHLDQIPPALQEVIRLYNTDRPHLSLNRATPEAVYFGIRSDAPPIQIPLAV
jgi:transposase InsO family protein